MIYIFFFQPVVHQNVNMETVKTEHVSVLRYSRETTVNNVRKYIVIVHDNMSFTEFTPISTCLVSSFYQMKNYWIPNILMITSG